MPMQSEAQRRYLWANEPAVAQEFEMKTPLGAKLPERVDKKAAYKRKLKEMDRGY